MTGNPIRGSVRCGLGRAVLAAGLLLASAMAGCAQYPGLVDPARSGPFFEPKNHAGDGVLPETLRRVLVLPVHARPLAEPESAAVLDEAVRTALQQQARFEVVALSRAECLRRFGTTELDSTGPLPHGLLESLQRSHACDAVLFIDLTAYRPYRPQLLGLRAKLATVGDTRLVWSFDEVFSAADPRVVNSVRRFNHQPEGPGAPPVEVSPAALQSPGRFAAYAADTMFRTLPVR